MEYKRETEYLVKAIMNYHSKGDSDIENTCYCKSPSEVVDVVYFFLNKLDKDKLKEISICPERRTYYKKGTV